MRYSYCLVVCLIALVAPVPESSAGEIAGLRSQLVPTTDPDFSLNFSNDFLGRGGSVDDFRTAQLIVASKLGENWFALLDHSTLTLEETPLEGRVDQVTGSLGYRFVDRESSDTVIRVAGGGGFRAAGEFSGESMQNGFHQIIGSEITDLPYVAASSTDLTLWADADYYQAFYTSKGEGFFGGWKNGYWIRAGSLATSDGQWDNALGIYAVTSRRAIDIWLGARSDWRSGYDQDFVQRATAAAESDIALVFGVRWGALVLETVQQLNNEASYGQLKLVSDGREPFPAAGAMPRFSIEFGFILPDVQLQLAGKIASHVFTGANSRWRESVVIDTRFGKPQYEDDPNLFVETRQVSVGMEWERHLSNSLNWISAYGAFGVGYRHEKILSNDAPAGDSDATGKATATMGTGLRFSAADLGGGWRYRLQLGLTGWLPASESDVQVAGQTVQLQQAGLGLSLGMTFDFE